MEFRCLLKSLRISVKIYSKQYDLIFLRYDNGLLVLYLLFCERLTCGWWKTFFLFIAGDLWFQVLCQEKF